MTWQPIETAPKDGTEVLACNGSWIFIAACDRFGWVDFAAGESRSPTHWMPLPELLDAILKEVKP